eukprot:TRINITY_DN11997_c0_g2_i1.p1 TRINITY_DN11997_c0_g2~~TRINITY_DN11997_c0_g2_i1.p1  ORF type:complete len:412 (-),score=23.87 TRINITY_DN11997_c0_g2_i1:2839-3912(-)
MKQDANNTQIEQSPQTEKSEFIPAEELVKKFVPIFHLHPKDEYMPCSVEWFIEHAKLKEQDSQSKQCTMLLGNGSLTREKLYEISQGQSTSNMELRINKEDIYGVELNKINDEAPVYVLVKEVINQDDDDDVEALEINYMTFYAYNGPYPLFGSYAFSAGYHEGDWEHITVRCNPRTGKLLGVYYNAHRSREGSWKTAEQVPVDAQTGRISAYVALHGHGTYPEPATFHRLLYVANDHSSCDGPTWMPKKLVLMSPYPQTGLSTVGPRGFLQVKSRGYSVGFNGGMDITVNNNNKTVEVLHDKCEWQEFEGTWGTTPGPMQQRWYHTAEQPVSRGYVKRVFLLLAGEVEHIKNYRHK